MAGNNLNLNPELIQATSDAVMTALIKSGAVKPPMVKQKRTNWERLLMYEYVKRFYADIPHWFREEVGPLPPGEGNMFYSRTRRWADAIVRMPDHMLIIEGKMKAKPDVVSQLLHYGQLLPQTPLFAKYKELPIKLKVVAALCDDESRKYIEAAGIEVEIYKPANFEAWYKQVIEKGTAEG